MMIWGFDKNMLMGHTNVTKKCVPLKRKEFFLLTISKHQDLVPKVADHPHPSANWAQKLAAETSQQIKVGYLVCL